MAASELRPTTLHTLYDEHQAWLQRWLRRQLGCSLDAADITQDTYERLIRSRHAPPDHPGESRSWLVRIAKSLVIDLYRRRRLEQAYLQTLASIPEREHPSAEVREIALETLIEIDAILDAMPSKAHQAFLLSRIDGLTYPEIARRLNVSVASVQKYMLTAVKAFCSALDPEHVRHN